MEKTRGQAIKTWLGENWFKAGILLAIFGAIYFLLVVPQQTAREENAKKETGKVYAKTTYDSCVDTAEFVYSAGWRSRCVDYKEFQEEGWRDCMNMPYAMKSICDSTWSDLPTKEEIENGSCTLPNTWADALNENMEKQKSECMNVYKMKTE